MEELLSEPLVPIIGGVLSFLFRDLIAKGAIKGYVHAEHHGRRLVEHVKGLHEEAKAEVHGK